MGQRGGADNGVAPPRTALTVGSCFAGIAGFDLGFERAGARIIWNCEIDANCRRVLRHHYPGVPRFRDVRTVTGAGLRNAGLVPDVLCGGSPYQDLSHAGRRAGLNGERSALFFEFARIADEAKPEWVVFENVSGLLNSHRGRDMAAVLGALVDIGYMGPGGCSMRDTPEFHNDAVASSLSDILVTGPVPFRYFLSPRACAGILRRAGARGRTILPTLERALRTVAGSRS